MASTYTNSLRLEKQGSFENNDTWGTRLNDSVIDLIDAAICGFVHIDCTPGGSIVLTTANGAADQARAAFLVLDGTPAADFGIQLPTKTKLYVVANNTLKVAAIGTGLAAALSLPSGSRNFIWCDGVTVGTCISGGTTTASAVSFVPAGGVLSGDVQNAIAELGNTKAPIANPIFQGAPQAPTYGPGTNSNILATTAFVQQAVAASMAGASGFQSGTRLVADMDVAPVGWIRDTNPYFNNRGVRLMGSAVRTDLNGNAYSTAFSYRTSDATAISVAQMPPHAFTGTTDVQGAHGHNVGTGTFLTQAGLSANITILGGGLAGGYIDIQGNHAHNFTTNTIGSGFGHQHTYDMSVMTRDLIIIQKL